ncbi:MAG TPA: CRISPR system precrRNA processing endoribonuclease RAMP protein Cas6 [Gemmataceae bacterium]|nr:CRISPR system precrRNA processing endoribonuclease RAMP protein Cas6 [Gemmataceae bacterium]
MSSTIGGHEVASTLRSLLAHATVWPRRLLLTTPDVHATVPMLRGAWGAALHDLDPGAYTRVFDPPAPAVPGYLLLPAPPDPATAPALDWFLFGPAAGDDAVLRRAWDVAAGRGLDKERRPFLVRRFLDLGPDGRPAERPGPWPLAEATWPADPAAPCRLSFPAPLRLLRRGRLIEQPTLADVVVAAHRRAAAWLPPPQQAAWLALRVHLLELARSLPSSWSGGRLDLERYSARQEAEVNLHGVSGVLELSAGVGALAPLLAAAAWLHLGKGTVFGLGQLQVETTLSGEEDPSSREDDTGP